MARSALLLPALACFLVSVTGCDPARDRSDVAVSDTAPPDSASTDTAACQPDCTGGQCGDDGCGGSCGTCPAGQTCNPLKRRCIATCLPDCAGKECGEDGCGGSCGTCPGAEACREGTCTAGPTDAIESVDPGLPTDIPVPTDSGEVQADVDQDAQDAQDARDAIAVADLLPEPPPEVPDSYSDSPDAPMDLSDTPMELPDTPPDPPEATSDLPGEEGILAPECAPGSVMTDCAAKCAALGPCQACTCNLDRDGGTCEVAAGPDDIACDDGDPCTQNDRCRAGLCGPGTSFCECRVDEDCALPGDGNRCNGTQFCDRDAFPYRCKVDPATVVHCPTFDDTFCRTSQCDPGTGACESRPAREGEACLLDDLCALAAACVAGECAATETRDCGDDNPCTTDSCDPGLGCIRLPNTDECDDDDVCTENDHCLDAACRAGTPRVCDDGRFCNGAETCHPESGCVAGTAPDCEDGVPCTEDSCNDELGECIHDLRADAVEGPRGDPTCSNSQDDDCDGNVDAADPECRFGLVSLDPIEGPVTGGAVVTLTGDALDLATKVFVDGVEVAFVPESPVAILVTMPPHAPGFVDVKVQAGAISHVLADAFRYVARSEDPSVVAALLGPYGEASIQEGEQAPMYEAGVTAAGITDADPPVPGALLGQFGYGPRGSLPWLEPSWRWSNADGAPAAFGSMRFTGSFTVAVGGYLDVAARFSVDGGASWIYADLDGTAGGYEPAQAIRLTVFGTPRPGALVINELMWMGSFDADNDEWVELRNLTPAPHVLAGWKLGGTKYPTGDIVLDTAPQVVTNLVIEPYGYFLVAQFQTARSAVAVVPDVAIVPEGSGAPGMLLRNAGPQTYRLEAPDGTVVDEARFSGLVGFHGDESSGKPVRSMERNAVPGSGTGDGDWHTAFAATGWKGDPRQVDNIGTPRAANSDIPLCGTDEECLDAYPDEVPMDCERRACRMPQARCGIAPVGDGGACDDGLFCTVGETCESGACGGGQPRDCADPPPLGPCTLDVCDEDRAACVHERDPSAVEGPGGSASCSDDRDDDCDGLTDGDDPQCRLALAGIAPLAIPASGGWTMSLRGAGLDIVTGVSLGGQVAASFTLVDGSMITFPAPEQPEPGDRTVTVTDGAIVAELAGAVRVIARSGTVLANTQWPDSAIQANLGSPTMLVFGRVFADGYTNVAPPADPSLISAEIGYGPVDDLQSDPWRDPGWTWAPAQFNAVCAGCVDVYEYMSTLQPPAVGSYLVAFRFSQDLLHFAYGDIGPLDGTWDPASALILVVTAPSR